MGMSQTKVSLHINTICETNYMSDRVPFPIKRTVFAVLILGLFMAGYARRKKNRPFTEAIQVMGTKAAVQFYGTDATTSRKAADAVWKVFKNVNNRFSNYIPSSELSQMNADAFKEPFKCSDEMWDMLTWCRKAHTLSHGAFDVTAGPIVTLWGIYRKEKKALPPKEEIDAALAKVGLDKVVFDDEAKTVRFTVDGMSIDVGGIAKGYAVDKAIEAVQGLGVTQGIIDLGGNLYCLSVPPPKRDTYVIGIRNPFQPDADPVVAVPFKGMAIATSGDYERYVTIDGKRYAHIMNVKTGKPVTGMAAVTVIAKKAIITDLLSTSIFINGGKHLEELAKAFPDIKVLIVKTDDPKNPKLVKFPKDDPMWNDVSDPKTWMPAE